MNPLRATLLLLTACAPATPQVGPANQQQDPPEVLAFAPQASCLNPACTEVAIVANPLHPGRVHWLFQGEGFERRGQIVNYTIPQGQRGWSVLIWNDGSDIGVVMDGTIMYLDAPGADGGATDTGQTPGDTGGDTADTGGDDTGLGTEHDPVPTAGSFDLVRGIQLPKGGGLPGTGPGQGDGVPQDNLPWDGPGPIDWIPPHTPPWDGPGQVPDIGSSTDRVASIVSVTSAVALAKAGYSSNDLNEGASYLAEATTFTCKYVVELADGYRSANTPTIGGCISGRGGVALDGQVAIADTTTQLGTFEMHLRDQLIFKNPVNPRVDNAGFSSASDWDIEGNKGKAGEWAEDWLGRYSTTPAQTNSVRVTLDLSRVMDIRPGVPAKGVLWVSHQGLTGPTWTKDAATTPHIYCHTPRYFVKFF